MPDRETTSNADPLQWPPGQVLEAEPPGQEPPQIVALLTLVMRDVGVVRAERETEQGARYRYRSLDDITARLQPALVDHGVIVVPREVRVVGEGTVQVGKGDRVQQWQRVVLAVRYRFTCAADGSAIECEAVGEGTDALDKASSKAMAMAMKAALSQALCIPVAAPDEQPAARPQARPQGRRDGTAPRRDGGGPDVRALLQRIESLLAAKARRTGHDVGAERHDLEQSLGQPIESLPQDRAARLAQDLQRELAEAARR